VKVIGIAHDTVKSMKKLDFCGYPMVADVSRKIVENYKTFMIKPNLWDSMFGHSKISRPIIFLIDQQGKIAWKLKCNVMFRPDPKKIFSAIDEVLKNNMDT
jgi:peroxiredoxin